MTNDRIGATALAVMVLGGALTLAQTAVQPAPSVARIDELPVRTNHVAGC